VRIPLDYYRILGLPLAATGEQLQQAYSDRIVQLPRREYSQAAITSRKQLLEEAYVVLSNPKERSSYDQLYLANVYDPEGSTTTSAAVAVENRLQENNGTPEAKSLGIDISQDELVGALLILQELGEYELVVKLGRPYLVNKNGVVSAPNVNGLTNQEFHERAERPDIILTVALACLELGREEWQQGHYENAALSLETGQDLLIKENLFLSVRAEIQADLCKLRPYRILELLALPEEKTAERRQGLELLQNVLEERGGIDGTGNDQSGLNIDDFLRFIQQLRYHLTAAEQQKIFEDESKRPSAVATYLAVYALIARGFAQRQPALIRQARQMLTRLGKRQDVHLEQSLCALLLGQTELATRSLELSQEYEALAFIREKSQDSPDMLPGLCLYGEHWLHNEVFPHFRDLVNNQASLKEYFADEQVQAYLESLPTDAQKSNESTLTNRQSSAQTQTNTYPQRSNSTASSHQFRSSRTEKREVLETPTKAKSEYSNYSPPSFTTSATPSTSVNGQPQQNSVPQLTIAERIALRTNYNLNGSAKANVPAQTNKRKRRKTAQTSNSGHPQRQRFPNTLEAKTRLVWMVFGSFAGLVVLWFLLTTSFGLLKNLFSPGPSLKGEQLSIQLNEPPIPIPDQNSKPQSPAGLLTEATAEEVIQSWLSSKALALGVNHDINSLEQILYGSTLSKWKGIVQQDKVENRYRKYNHTMKVESVRTTETDQNQAVVDATVTELAEFYDNGQINHQKSYNEKVRVRYDLVRVEGSWRIKDMSVLSKISGN
jgi:ARC6-like, IMS domain/DnaJ domain